MTARAIAAAALAGLLRLDLGEHHRIHHEFGVVLFKRHGVIRNEVREGLGWLPLSAKPWRDDLG